MVKKNATIGIINFRSNECYEKFQELYKEFCDLKKDTEIKVSNKERGKKINPQFINVSKIMRRVEIAKILKSNLNYLKLDPSETHEIISEAGLEE